MHIQSPNTTINPAHNGTHTAEVRATSLVPDASYLLAGEYSQSGFDLIITNPAGEQFVVADYFAQDPPPNLMLASGVGLSPEMVRALLHLPFTDDLLFAGPAAGAELGVVIGTVKFVLGRVIAIGSDGAERVLKKGDSLHQGDEIRTDGQGFIRAEMNDGTRFHLGKNGRAVLENYAFDEAANVGRFEAKVFLGGFHYQSGKIGTLNPGLNHSQIKTPSAIIGIRGSALDGTVDRSGQTIVIHRSGILEVTDINGENAVYLYVPGNTSVIVFNGIPGYFQEATETQRALVEDSLPPVDTGVDDAAVEEEAVETGTPEEGAAEGEAGAEADVSDAGDEEGGAEAEGEEESEAEVEEADEGEVETDAEETVPEETTDTGDAEPDATGADSADTGASTGLDSPTSPDSSSPDSTLFDQEVFDEFVTEGGDSSSRETGTGQDDDTTTELTDPLEPEPIEPVVEELPPDNPPQAGADEISVNAVEAIDLTDLLLANDADPDENQSPTVSGFDATGTLGTVTLSAAEGRLFYVADNEAHLALAENETSTDLFRYTVTSGDLTATATVTLTITGVNDAPTSENRTITIEEDQPYRFSAADFAFADLDTGAVFDSVVITGLPTGGTLSLVTMATASEGGFDDPADAGKYR